MKKTYLIGIDVGTSGTKCVLFDTEGNALFSVTEEYPLYQPHNGWAEQNPEDWWNAAKTALKKVYENAKDGEIAGIGLSGQMHSLVLLDKDNKVIRPAILWCDQRTSAECEDIENIIGHSRLIEITANPALPGFTASKIMWVKKNEPENFGKIEHILLAKDYIRFMLTGEYATEVSDASGMQLLDVKNRCWSEEVCEKLGVKMEWLAKVYESCEVTGRITSEIASVTGLPEGIPVAGGGGDNACAAIGTGVCKDGKAFTTIGTSGVVFAHTNELHTDKLGRIHAFCCAVPGAWHVMGVTQAAGLSLNWFRNQIAKEYDYRELDSLASEIPIGCDSLVYLPYLMGERSPVLDAGARGVFFGLSAMHGRADMLRAVMEGVTFSLLDCMNIIRELGTDPDFVYASGGGGNSKLWRQMMADAFGVRIAQNSSREGGALGVAILAGVGAGVYDSVAGAAESIIHETTSLDPVAETVAKYEKVYALYDKLYEDLRDSYKQLAAL